MRAVVIREFGGPGVLQPQDVDAPRPGPNELLINVNYTALNRADLLQRLGKYPPPSGVRPDIPGLEFSGEVAATGARASRWKGGDRVMGLLSGGGYAEQVVTHERMVMPAPNTLSMAEAAAIPEAFLTAFDALFARLNLQKGEGCLVHSVGSGVGLAALQLAKSAGATVFGTSRTAAKLEQAGKFGLDAGIHSPDGLFAEKLLAETSGAGVDAILDTLGAEAWKENLKVLKSQGRLVLVGLLTGARTEVNLAQLLAKRAQVVGTVLRGRSLQEKIDLTEAFSARCLPLFADGKLKPVIDRTFPLEAAAAAHERMHANRNFGKILLRVR